MSTVKATCEESDKPRLLWKFQYDPALVEAGKQHVAGARWRKSDKTWTAPLTVDNCLALREAYGDQLEIKSPLATWYRANAVERAAAVQRVAADDAECPRLAEVAPRLSATLRPDQRVGVRAVADAYRGSLLIADKPGLGKTLETIGGILEADVKGPILILCPKISVKSVWAKELHRWTDEKVFIARGTRSQREAALRDFWEYETTDRKWLVVVAEMLRVKRKPNDTSVKSNAKKRGRVEGYEYPQLFENIWPWSVIVADESHRLLGSLTVAKSNLMGEGLAKLPLNPAVGRKYAISGTPFGRGGRVQGMFGTLHWLWNDEYTSFWKWAGTIFNIESETVARGRTVMKIGEMKKGMDAEKFMASLGPRILRRTKEEVLKNLPPKQYIEVTCEMEGKQLSQYRQLGDDAEVRVDGGTIMANGVLAELTRAKQIASGVLAKRPNGDVYFTGESCKVEKLMAMLDARGITDGSGDTKVIVSSRYNAFLEGCVFPALEKAGIEYHVLTGKTSDAKREKAMGEFQGEGGPRVFVLNSKAGGVSITLDAADEVHCLDELDNPEDNEQLEDRAHRASRIHQVTIYYYRTEGTIDRNIEKNVEDKRQAQFEVLDGRRGIEDVRKWIKYDPEGE